MVNQVVVVTPAELGELIAEAVRAGVGAALQGHTPQTPREMDEKEAGAYLNIRPATLRIWRTQKKGPKYHKSGRLVRYARKDLDEWLKRGEIQTIDSLEAGHEKGW